MTAEITPAEAVKRQQLAQDALLDAVLALRDDKPEQAIVLAAIAVQHLSHIANLDATLRLTREAMREVKL